MLGMMAGMPLHGEGNPAWLVAGLVVLVLHLVASIKLSQGRSVWVTLGLVIGGWILMPVFAFVGCVVRLLSVSR